MSNLDLAGRHILLAEDDYMVAGSLCRLLECLGATIIGPAATAEHALALLAQADRVDFAMVDINLRGAASFAVADALRARGVRFAFATGYGTSAIPKRYRDAAVLQKPFDLAEMAKAVQTI
jgi:DNA-binding NarL/FixJ family response regulator